MSQQTTLAIVLQADEIQSEGRQYSIVATEEEMTELVKRFDILDMSRLTANVSVAADPQTKGFRIEGVIEADLVQKCIVTLGEVEEQVRESFELLLVSPEQAEAFDEEELYADPEAPDYDAFEGTELPLGEVVVQTVSVMMEPYPRVKGAEVAELNQKGISVNEELEKRPNPFAVLSQMRDKS